jgi:hypothetical protein
VFIELEDYSFKHIKEFEVPENYCLFNYFDLKFFSRNLEQYSVVEGSLKVIMNADMNFESQ